MAVSSDQPAAAPPGRLRRLIRPPLWRAAARGIAAVLIATACVVVPTSLGWTMLGIFFGITVGLNVGLWAGRDSGLASFAGAVLMPVVAIAIAIGADVQMIGSRSGAISPRDIGHYPHAANLRFTDARIATEFTAVADASRLAGIWRVAPIVPTNWTSAEPVPAWAVAVVSGYGPRDFRTPRSWQQDYRAAVRFVPTAFSPAHSAIERALARYDLTASPDAPLLYWVEEPQTVITNERTDLAWIMFGGVATWLCFLIGEALLVPASTPPDAERGPPPRTPRARQA
jgi:hypothetical protein